MRGSDRSLVSAIRGPITLITVGVLFALNNFTPYQFHQTWPVLLIVFGLLTLLRRSVEPVPPVGPAGYAPPPPYNYPPPPASAGGYRQTPYAESPSPSPSPAPAKGGFGTTPHPNDSSETPGGSV
jgi:hypothetical protein